MGENGVRERRRIYPEKTGTKGGKREMRGGRKGKKKKRGSACFHLRPL